MKTEDMFTVQRQIKSDINFAFSSCQHAYELVQKDTYNRAKDDVYILYYVSEADSYMASAKAIYYSCIQFVESLDFEDVILQMNVFIREISNNCITNHSHQWTITEFIRLREIFNDSMYCPTD